LKIIFIISDIGKSLHFEWIAEHIDQNRFNASFILLNPGPSAFEDHVKNLGFNVQRILCRGKRDWPNAFYKTYLILKKENPDVIHCHMIQANIIGLFAGKLAGIKKRFYTRHHSDFHQRYFPKGVLLDKFSNSMATSIIAPSGAVKEVLIKLENVSEKKIYIVHHGFKLDSFNYVPKDRICLLKTKYHVNGHRPVIGVISRFTELKGIQYIIPAFVKLLKIYPGALLLLFNAKGDYEKEIKAQLAGLPEDSYRVIVFEEDLQAIYRLFDVFIQASIDRTIESFGLTYIEALASGVPSIFTLAGIAPDIIVDGKNALVVPFKNSEAIFEAMLQILQNDSLKNNLQRAGHDTVTNKFEMRQMIDQLEELYEN
jgi:glycosyltransferase involved in cell wall biosynthesis